MIEYRAASDDELEACVQLQHLVFRPDEPDAPDRYRSYVREDPTYRLGQTRVAVLDGEIVGHLRVWDRKHAVRGATITAGGIGSLLTHPNHRGKGIASGLLADTERYFREAEYDIGLLFSIIGTPYYEARGWTPIPLSTFEIDTNGVAGLDVSPRELTLDRDLDAVRALHRECSASYTATEIRDAAYWSSGPARYRSVFPRVGIERAGKVAGYVNWDLIDGQPWVIECCASDDEVYADLAALVLQAAHGVGSGRILGSLPQDYALLRALEEVTSSSVRWDTHDEMMVKISRWDLLRAKLDLPEAFPTSQPEIDAFWRALLGADADSDWSRRLGLCPPTFYWWTDIF